MNFKDWLELYEEATVVSGPFTFYHGTDTGKDGEVLKAFMTQGAKPIGGGHGQGGGFFVHTTPQAAKTHALDRPNLTTNTASAGMPMLVAVEVPTLDFSVWDLDIEGHGADLLRYASKRMPRLNKLGAQQLVPQTADYLSKDKGNTPGQVNFDKSRKTKFGTLAFKTTDVGFGYRDPYHKDYDPVEDAPSAGTGSRLAPFYYAHKDAAADRHQKLEKWFFTKFYGKRNLLLKYRGTEPLMVRQLLIHNGNDWVSTG